MTSLTARYAVDYLETLLLSNVNLPTLISALPFFQGSPRSSLGTPLVKLDPSATNLGCIHLILIFNQSSTTEVQILNCTSSSSPRHICILQNKDYISSVWFSYYSMTFNRKMHPKYYLLVSSWPQGPQLQPRHKSQKYMHILREIWKHILETWLFTSQNGNGTNGTQECWTKGRPFISPM